MCLRDGGSLRCLNEQKSKSRREGGGGGGGGGGGRWMY